MAETVRFNITMSSDLHDYFKQQADKAGVSMSAFMSIVLLDYKERREKEFNASNFDSKPS